MTEQIMLPAIAREFILIRVPRKRLPKRVSVLEYKAPSPPTAEARFPTPTRPIFKQMSILETVGTETFPREAPARCATTANRESGNSNPRRRTRTRRKAENTPREEYKSGGLKLAHKLCPQAAQTRRWEPQNNILLNKSSEVKRRMWTWRKGSLLRAGVRSLGECPHGVKGSNHRQDADENQSPYITK